MHLSTLIQSVSTIHFLTFVPRSINDTSVTVVPTSVNDSFPKIQSKEYQRYMLKVIAEDCQRFKGWQSTARTFYVSSGGVGAEAAPRHPLRF